MRTPNSGFHNVKQLRVFLVSWMVNEGIKENFSLPLLWVADLFDESPTQTLTLYGSMLCLFYSIKVPILLNVRKSTWTR